MTGQRFPLSENSTVVESGKVLHRVVEGHQLEQCLIVKRTEQVGVQQELFRTTVCNHISKVLQFDGIGKNAFVAVVGQGTFIPAENRSHNGQSFLLVYDGRITCHHIVVKEIMRTEAVYVSNKQTHFSRNLQSFEYSGAHTSGRPVREGQTEHVIQRHTA